MTSKIIPNTAKTKSSFTLTQNCLKLPDLDSQNTFFLKAFKNAKGVSKIEQIKSIIRVIKRHIKY
jgi:hypothetical protein